MSKRRAKLPSRTSSIRPARISAAASTDSTSSSGAGVSAYDAANDSPNRSSFVAFPTNSRRELTPATRREIVKKMRALEANCPELTRIHRKYARHAVGSGIHFRFLTDDEKWNDAARRDVEEWWNNPMTYSIDGSLDGWNAKHFAVETILLDGEFNCSFVNTASGWPMIQPWDVFEIETPAGKIDGSPVDPVQWDDGVRISPLERPIGFAVRVLPRTLPMSSAFGSDYRVIPQESMIHLGRRRRVRGHRFLPAAYSGMNMGIDGLDLGSLISGTAKLHSGLAVQVKKTGKRGEKGAVGAISKLGAGEDPTDTKALEKVYGSMINYVGENGEIDLKSSQHPGSNLLEFKKMLFAELCLPYDVPSSVMLDMSGLGGTAVRSDMEDAQSAFDMMYDLIAWQFVRREIIWKIATSIKAGRLPQPADPFWFTRLVMRGPRKLTVDIGRMANAFKTLSRNAGVSIPRWFEEQGLDADQEMADNIRFLKRVRARCAEEDVPVEWIYEATPGSQTTINVSET